MKKILVFGASNSHQSINRKLALYAGSMITSCDTVSIDLNDFEMPLFSVDREKEIGVPYEAKKFKDLIKSVNGIIISLAEHNGSYTVAFKNIVDWTSRIEGKLWEDKPMLLLATSPGKRGGKSVLNHAVNDYPYRGAKVINQFSLPSFNENFKNGKIIDDQLNNKLNNLINDFQSQICNHE